MYKKIKIKLFDRISAQLGTMGDLFVIRRTQFHYSIQACTFLLQATQKNEASAPNLMHCEIVILKCIIIYFIFIFVFQNCILVNFSLASQKNFCISLHCILEASQLILIFITFFLFQLKYSSSQGHANGFAMGYKMYD